MRDLHQLDRYRQRGPHVLEFYGWEGDHEHGAFVVPSCIDKQPLVVVASASDDWDHVSVSRRNRCPNWAEMEQIKRMFFADDETAMQLHVPPTDHVNAHPNCLHLWRPQRIEIPRPPSIMVGLGDKPIRDLEEAMVIRKRIFGDA